MKITILLLIAAVSINPDKTGQKPAETSPDIYMLKEIATSEMAMDYEKHPALAVIRNCN